MGGVLLRSTHIPGRHCASSAISDLVRFHGLDLSEAMCFGIGSGLGAWYLQNVPNAPSRMIHVRSADIEAKFFKRIGCPFSWSRFPGADQALDALRASLHRGLPTLVQTDIYYLGYYQSSTHFPGHDIVVWGCDDQEGVFFVTDTERPDVIRVPSFELARSMFAEGGFFPMEGNSYAPEAIATGIDLGGVIERAIVSNSRLILSEDLEFQGIAGLRLWLREVKTSWPGLEDWRWAARFAYQVIERRGTGGGGFRIMYADFLDEAAPLCPAIAELGLGRMMREASRAWTRLALRLKEASEGDADALGPVGESIEEVIERETAYHRNALRVTGR